MTATYVDMVYTTHVIKGPHKQSPGVTAFATGELPGLTHP
jgi:hypothetical protein